MDNLPIGIAVNSVDPTVTFEYMNDNFFKFYRTTREALTETNSFWETIYEDADFREKLRQRVLDDCASGDPARMRWEDIPVTRTEQETFFNDTYGHSTGDEILKSAAEILKKSCREVDIIARWGGDEFVILMPQTTEKQALEMYK